MTSRHPVVQRYLDDLDAQLARVGAAERREIVQEIDNHLGEGIAAGRPVEELLAHLGPADALARAYAIERLLNPRKSVLTLDRWLRVIGVLALGSLPSFVIIITLGAMGLAFTVAGAATLMAGIAGLAGATWVNPDVNPALAAALGPLLLALGLASLAGLTYYVRFIVRITRQTLARAR